MIPSIPEEGISGDALFDEMLIHFDRSCRFAIFRGFLVLDEFGSVDDEAEVVVGVRGCGGAV